MATTVNPAASAVSSASEVGAETATIIGARIAAAFCTISTETRLVSSTAPPAPFRPARASAPANLSSALWRPTSSRTATRPSPGVQKAAAWTARVRAFSACAAVSDAIAAGMSSGATLSPPDGSGEGARVASSRLSMPHRPQPVGPASRRRRPASARPASGASHIRASTPAGEVAISMRRTSPGEAITPSVRLKPRAKSSRSAGVAIITA